MREAFVLMTALPPTVGHLELIKFASALMSNGSVYYRDYNVTVLVCTQPGEPFPEERFFSLQEAVSTAGLTNVRISHFHQTMPQEPGSDAPAFWRQWRTVLDQYGYLPGDYLVSSEKYGVEMAEQLQGVFMPFDIERRIEPTKATSIRKDPCFYFRDILPEFRPFLRKTITFFGAESVGKTTASYAVAALDRDRWLHEWARPYLEAVGPHVTTEKMHRIHEGQRALQIYGQRDTTSEFVIQDTDLFSTVGYWEMWDKASMPEELLTDARKLQSDLYVILSSDIPFKDDPLRYGGTHRETSDQYWIDLCERENLPYIVITDTINRWETARTAIREYFPTDYLNYQREGKEYENV